MTKTPIKLLIDYKNYKFGQIVLFDEEEAKHFINNSIGLEVSKEEYQKENKIINNYKQELKKPIKIKKDNKEEEHIKIFTSSFIFNNRLYEQVKNGNFISYNEEEFIFSPFIYNNEEEIVYYPCEGEELEKDNETVILAEEPKEYETPVILIEELRKHIHAYLDVSEQFEIFAAQYILLTWVYDQVPTINYLSVMGDTGVGKSRFFDVVGSLCYKSIRGSGAVSVAALKRLCNKWKGTLCIDEGDFKESDETQEMIKFFNLGFEKNRKMFNCNKNDPAKLEFFDPYCPKVITRRRQFTDQALEARCLTEVMQQTNRKDIPALLLKDYNEEAKTLRNKLLKFRFDYYNKIDANASLKIDMGDIEPRIKQATMAFITLLANIPDALDKFKLFIKDYNKQLIEERANSFDGQIINTIKELLEEGITEISSQDIELRLNIAGLKTNNKVIGKHLNQLKIETKQTKINNKIKRLILFNDQFYNVLKRYVVEVSSVSSVSSVSLDALSKKSSIGNRGIENHTSFDTHDTHDTHDTNIDFKSINYPFKGRCVICNQWVFINPDNYKCQKCDEYKTQSAQEEDII